MPTAAEVLANSRLGIASATNVTKSPRTRQTRVLVADDHPVVRKGLANCLGRHKQLTVVGEAENGLDAISKARELSPDIVLMDIDMPELNGLSAAEVLHKEHPRMKIVILTTNPPAHDAIRILNTGASGFLSKAASPEELILAIERISAGLDSFSMEVAQAAMKQMIPVSDLSAREREVLVAIADGLSNKEIATRLDIEVRTVETHRERLMRKLNLRGIADLTRFAIRQGLVSMP